jgi:hypothetical protein
LPCCPGEQFAAEAAGAAITPRLSTSSVAATIRFALAMAPTPFIWPRANPPYPLRGGQVLRLRNTSGERLPADDVAVFLVGARGFEPLTLFRVKEGRYSPLTSVFAAQAHLELAQEFRLVPLGSVGSLTRC